MTATADVMQSTVNYAYPQSQPSLKRSTMNLTGVLLGVSMYLAGSGGAVTVENFQQFSAWTHSPRVVFRREENEPNAVDQRQTKEHVVNIRKAFGLNVSELAQAFGVSRPAVYGWLDGTEPKPEMQKHIFALSRFGDDMRQAGLNRPEHFLHRPLFDGKSLFDLMKEGGDLHSAIATIGELARHENATRINGVERKADLVPQNNYDSIDEYATPFTLE